jgi:putative ABC transport system substrate-binding protein
MYETPPLAQQGGLAGYGPITTDLFQRSAYYVDRILKGTKPADLPVERPTRFYLYLNLPAAEAIGLTVPPAVLRDIDQMIR